MIGSAELISGPRVNCDSCWGSGLTACLGCDGRGFVICPSCGGDGRAGGIIECSCQYSESARQALRCLACNSTGQQKCSCVREIRIRWIDHSQLLGQALSPIDMMAEKDSGQKWAFFTRDVEQPKWSSFPSTSEAVARAEEVLADITAQRQLVEVRQSLHFLVDSLPDGALNTARNALQELQESN